MPFYSVRLKQPDVAPTQPWDIHEYSKVHDLPMMKFEELQKFLADNPQYEQVIANAPAVRVH